MRYAEYSDGEKFLRNFLSFLWDSNNNTLFLILIVWISFKAKVPEYFCNHKTCVEAAWRQEGWALAVWIFFTFYPSFWYFLETVGVGDETSYPTAYSLKFIDNDKSRFYISWTVKTVFGIRSSPSKADSCEPSVRPTVMAFGTGGKRRCCRLLHFLFSSSMKYLYALIATNLLFKDVIKSFNLALHGIFQVHDVNNSWKLN